MPVMTGLSGNEIFCLNLKGYRPGDLVIGNSVFSMGFLGSLAASGRGLLGGEVSQVTRVIHEGRLEAYSRMAKEASDRGGVGITGVTNQLRKFHNNTEFLSIASCLHHAAPMKVAAPADSSRTTPPPLPYAAPAMETISFSTSANGQELYCQMDSGFQPLRFVFGNVAYSVGATSGILGSLKSMARGEIKEFSDVFNHTRHLALERISAEALAAGANSVVGIETRTMRFQGVHEMLMLGTASRHPKLPEIHNGQPVTSDLTNEEMWNLVNIGYLPLKLVLGTAVYSLGIVGGIKAALQSFSRGEVTDLTSLIYDAREHALGLIADEANVIGADDVIGIRTHIHDHGNLLEFMAIGTAVKRHSDVTTVSATLPPQAIIRDKDTWRDEDTPQTPES